MLGTLDFTGSEHWASFSFYEGTALVTIHSLHTQKAISVQFSFELFVVRFSCRFGSHGPTHIILPGPIKISIKALK